MTVLFGILVGLALGLTGGGGSILALPLLVYGIGMGTKAAVSTSLAAVTLTAAVGATDAWRAGLVETRVALIFAVTGMLAAPAGVVLGDRVSDLAIILGFAVLMLIVGTRMFIRARSQPGESGVVRAGLGSGEALDDNGPVCRYSEDGVLRLNAPCSAALAAVGVIVGFLSGLFGVGGGFLIVPALLMVTQMSIHRAVATSLLVITLIGISGVGAALTTGRELPWLTTALFVLGGVGGMFLGRWLAARLAGPVLQEGFAVGIVVIGAAMIMAHFMGVGII